MKFTVETEPFVRLLEMLVDRRSGIKSPGATVCLSAFQGRVCAELNGTIAEIEAEVWENGQCQVPCRKLLRALEKQHQQEHIILSAQDRRLQVGQRVVPVRGYSRAAILPRARQIFFASNLGIVPLSPDAVCSRS